jgi:DnaJ-class molecular chaperone
MEIERCFAILELDRNASLEEAKQSYRDQVKFFHPDRFAHDPRQKDKAEKKLKEVNEAYERVKAVIASTGKADPVATTANTVKEQGQAKPEPVYPQDRQGFETKDKEQQRTGSGIIRTVISSLSGAFRRMLATEVAEREQRQDMQPREKARGKGGGRGMGRGKRSGRGRGKGKKGR